MSKKLLNLCMAMLLSMVCTAAWALSEVGGVYQIGTAADLAAFAELVNGGKPFANAVLTADIDKGADLTMIGRDGLDYQGFFDGQGHTITIDAINQASQGTAIFRNIGLYGVVQNLKVQGNIVTDKKLAAGIAAWSSGTIRGCYADINVTSAVAGDATHAGIAAVTYNCAVIENCLAKIVITGSATENCGGVVGWASGRTNIVNCLVVSDGSSFKLSNNGSNNICRNDGNLNVVNLSSYNQDIYNNRPNGASYNNYVTNNWGANKATNVVAYADLADGRICYQLNNDQSEIAWVQTIGTDPFPVPAAFGSGRVYASAATDCDGKSEGALTFSNSGSDTATKHSIDKFGVCSACGYYNFHGLDRDVTDGALLLKSAADIGKAESLNRFQDGFRLNLKMADDIEYTADPGRSIFNTSNWYHGNFDGQGHTLTIYMSDMGSNASFIPQLGGTFENVIMHGSINTDGQFAGSVTSHTRNGDKYIRNVFSDIEINTTHGGDNTSAGLIGVNEVRTYVDNCIYAGNINGNENTECLAGICGWSAGQLLLTNCAFVGTLNNAIGDSKNISRNPGNVTSDNVYVIEAQEFGDQDANNFIVFDGGPEGVESGQLAFYLNGKKHGFERFYQKIGEDLFPMPIAKEGALVYAASSSYTCDGVPASSATYTNNPSSVGTIPSHEFEDNGFCANCGSLDEDFLTPDADGWFDISNAAELIWWTNYAAEHLDVSARLTDDIDVSEYSELDEDGNCLRWANVGTEKKPFYGNFDGQFHTISNLKINHPNSNGVGLIAVMNSMPSKGLNYISDSDARAAEGVFIKDVVLDESCSITGRGYVALVGMTAPWAGHVNIKGVMMCGDVTAKGGANAAGVFGCVMTAACHVTIDNCGMVGNVYGPTENGSFSGWLGSYAEVTNCFAVGSVEGIQDNDHYFARGNDDALKNIKNCYARYGTQVPTVSEEDFASGALAWRANGNQFRTSYWYQTIGDDPYPFPDPSHGTVIYAAEQYFSVANEEELAEVAAAVKTYEEEKIESLVATQSVLDDFAAALSALSEATTTDEFADVLDTLAVKKEALNANAAVYQAYIKMCEDIKTRLDSDDSFQGDLRTALEEYLDDANYEGPSDENPLGTYDYIITEHTATAEEIAAETARLDAWLQAAIAEDYKAGTDVSNLIPNGDFSKQKENWTNGWSTGYGQTKNEEGKTFVGVEAWNVTGDQYQTVEGMKPGYYLVGINGAFRPSNDRYSTNYAAGIYANGIFNYFPAVIEDPVYVDDAVDGVNCNLHVKSAYDLNIYEEIGKTSGADSIGFVVHGETGMAIAAKAGRYQVYTIANVGEDGKLTIGIKNPGTHYSNDWTGWGPLTVTFCGEDSDEASDALDQVLDNMAARANTIMEYEYNDENAAAAPNFPAEFKDRLEVLIAAVADAESIEEKDSLAKEFSDVFQAIYEGKQAYISLSTFAKSLESIESGNLPIVTRNEADEREETGDFIFTDDETTATWEASDELLYAYSSGSYSTEEAQQAIVNKTNEFAYILPQKDEEGYYLIGTVRDLVVFRAIATWADNTVKGKMTADIDLDIIAMQPIGMSDFRYRGTFDGQGHALTNVYIEHYGEARTGLFNTLDNATVKNLKLTGEYSSDQKFIGGLTGYTYNNTRIENCDVAVKIYSTVSGDGTHGGLIGVNDNDGTVVNNCLVNCPMSGQSTDHCGGVVGWATGKITVQNTLILSQGHTVGGNESNTISRNPDNCTVSNVYYVEQLGSANGTKVTAEQLASGEITYKLNGSKSEGDLAWFQTVGTDAAPHLFDGDVVYFYGNQYINEKPNPQLNAFAYNLDAKLVGDNVIVSFTLNADAEDIGIDFYRSDWTHIPGSSVSVPEEALTAGSHSVSVPISKFDGVDPTTANYDVSVVGKGSLDILQVGESYKFNSPYGLAVNNNPASKGFGQVLITESRPTEDREGMFSTGTPGALFAFDAAFQPVGSYYGGLDIANETPLKLFDEYELDLKDLRFSKDGRLFVGRASGTSASSVWEINPDDLSEPWSPVFTEGELDEATGITYMGDVEQNRPAVGLALEGEGDALKMYVLGVQGGIEEVTPTAFNCAVYDLGVSKHFNLEAPSSYVTALDGQYAAIPTHIGIHEDGQGGLWFIQSAGTLSEESPAIKHFDAEGNEDYSDISTNTHSGKMALTSDGKYIAIATGSNKVVLYQTNYVPMANGSIFLNPKFNISTSENNITGLAFDYANNMYVASSGTKTLSRYVIPFPKDDIPAITTPGNGIVLGVQGDVNNDGKVDVADAQFVLINVADGGTNLNCDVNGDGKVDVADVQTILIIVADQQ